MDSITVAHEAVSEHGALQKPAELARFLDLLVSAGARTVIEIGSDAGGTLWAWSQVPSVSRVVAVSLPGMAWGPARTAPELHGATLIAADSTDPATVPAVRRALCGQLADVLFIDADHSYEATCRNFVLYAPLVRRRGGMIAFHDIAGLDGVRRAWDEISAPLRHTEIIEPPRDREGIGVIWTGGSAVAEQKTTKQDAAQNDEKTPAKRAAPQYAEAAASTDPAVQFVLAKREIAIRNGDGDAIAACDEELAALGVA